MSRKKQSKKRIIQPDKKYNSILVQKLINKIMYSGKKTLAEKIVYSSFEIIEKKIKKNVIVVFEKAIENTMPHLELKSRRIGGSNYQVPFETKEDRKLILSLRWIIEGSRSRSEKTMQERLAKEIIDAYNNVGFAIKKKDNVHKMANANRAFIHYRW